MADLTLDTNRKHSLGKRAYILFLSRRIKFSLFLFILAAGVWYAQRWFTGANLIWATFAFQIALIISIVYFLCVVMWTYLEYRFYTYMFTEEAFIMTSGYVIRNELAALYHQIQNVSVQRTPLDRIVGVSRIVIIMTGADRDVARNTIVLPAVGSKKAKLVQKELLARARRHEPNYDMRDSREYRRQGEY